MQTSVRKLKARLNQLLKRVEAGATVTVRVHNRPVAAIVLIRNAVVFDQRLHEGAARAGLPVIP